MKLVVDGELEGVCPLSIPRCLTRASLKQPAMLAGVVSAGGAPPIPRCLTRASLKRLLHAGRGRPASAIPRCLTRASLKQCAALGVQLPACLHVYPSLSDDGLIERGFRASCGTDSASGQDATRALARPRQVLVDGREKPSCGYTAPLPPRLSHRWKAAHSRCTSTEPGRT